MKRLVEYHRVKILCGILYMFCLFNVLGISVNFPGQNRSTVGEGRDAVAEETFRAALEKNGNTDQMMEKPKIAITFDDGPSKAHTGKLLDGLKERNVKATFFLIGESAKNNPELVKRLDQEGHLIGNHTYHHVQITQIPDAEAAKEIQDTDEVIYNITGKHVEYMRPPFGAWQKKLEAELKVMPVLWSVDPLDWTTSNVDEIVNKVVTETDENDIILLHDCYDSSVEAALRIIDILQKKGFEFVTVDELIVG